MRTLCMFHIPDDDDVFERILDVTKFQYYTVEREHCLNILDIETHNTDSVLDLHLVTMDV